MPRRQPRAEGERSLRHQHQQTLFPLDLDIPNRPFAAYLFDCDGTLVNTMPLHYIAWLEGLESQNAPYTFTEEKFYSYAGIREQQIVELLNGEHGAEVDPEAVVEVKLAAFGRLMHQVEILPAVVEIARSKKGSHPLAVVSGSEAPHVHECLRRTGIGELFDTVVTPADVAPGRGKPAPDMFLLAAERLGVAPGDCLVFEDGQSGIDAAHAAGMASVFVPRIPLSGKVD